MPRVQTIVRRDDRILMVKHRWDGREWWCLPGGALEGGESPAEGALRELSEECNVHGELIRQTSHVVYGPDDETYSFLVEIGDQQPSLGRDPDVEAGQEVLVDVQWLRLREIPERDRTFLWAAGLLGVADFVSEVESWGNATSYPPEMQTSTDHGESVLFALTEGGRVLCEVREWSGEMMESVPGGKVEPIDRKSDNYQVAALRRELSEELGVTPVKFGRIGEVWYREEWVFHVFVVSAWNGELPETNRESNRPLRWVQPSDLRDNHYMQGLSDLLRETIA